VFGLPLSAFGAAHSGEPVITARASRAREALPLIYYYRSPMSHRLTARCGAKGAKKSSLARGEHAENL